MKQKRFGEKVQNWHRPLQANQLRQRFLRNRYEDPEAEAETRELTSNVTEFDWFDECWNPWGPYCVICGKPDCGEQYDQDSRSTGDELHAYKLWKYLTELTSHKEPLLPSELSTATDQSATVASTAPSADSVGATDVPVENRLAQFVISIAQGRFETVLSAVRTHVTDAARDTISHHRGVLRPELIFLFSPFWIRDPASWRGAGINSLLDHLFVSFSVPQFLYAEWNQKTHASWGDERHHAYLSSNLKWLCWFILIGQGASLKQASDLFGWPIHKGFQQHLADVAPDAMPVEACISAEVFRLKGSRGECDWILSHHAYAVDPTEQLRDPIYAAFWRDTVHWLVMHREALGDVEAHLILDWAIHAYTERVREGRRFSWKRRRVATTLARSREYRQQQRTQPRSTDSYRWKEHGWDYSFTDGQDRWTFVELTTGEELHEEGSAMCHCVASYVGRCVAGQSAIVSVRCNDERCLTLEVNPAVRQVVQARGKNNRASNAIEMRAINRWQREVLE